MLLVCVEYVCEHWCFMERCDLELTEPLLQLKLNISEVPGGGNRATATNKIFQQTEPVLKK